VKITSVRTVVVNAEMRNWVFVRVDTDEDGLYGWGEASLEWKTRAVCGAVDDLAPLIVGEDAGRIEHVMQRMIRHSFWPHGPISMSAISGIEHALWDIFGKSLGKPVYELLGGAVRDRLRMYTHLGGGDMRAVYDTVLASDPALLVERAREVFARGYTAVKVLITPPTGPLASLAAYRATDTMMAALRDAVGDDVEIMVDMHGRHTAAVAREFCRVLAPYRPFFVEEPVAPENFPALAEVAHSVDVPIATGERLVSRLRFRELLEYGACAVIQPDLCHCGGLWEARKIAAIAETWNVGVAPHNPLGPIANAVALHFGISTPNFVIQEDMLGDVPWRFDVVSGSLAMENGFWLIPDQPGLGIEVDEMAAKRHPFKQETIHAMTAVAPDGAVLDW
jgi:galactonate dehydratase